MSVESDKVIFAEILFLHPLFLTVKPKIVMIFKLTRVQAKQLPWYICYFLLLIQFHVNGQNGEIRDCNGKDMITQVTVRSSSNQQLTLTNCIYTLDNELGLNLANDAHYNGKVHGNISRFNDTFST